MRRFARLAGLTLVIQPLVSCGSCPPPEVEVGDRVRVVIGAPEGSGDVPCDAVGLGVGAEFIGEVADTHTLGPIDSGPLASSCVAHLFTGPVSVASDWTFALRPNLGANIWGGAFAAQLGEGCTGTAGLHVSGGDKAHAHLTVSFSPETGASCPEKCSSRHTVTVEIMKGEGGGSGGSSSSGGAEPSTSGGASGAGAGGANPSGGASTG